MVTLHERVGGFTSGGTISAASKGDNCKVTEKPRDGLQSRWDANGKLLGERGGR